MPITLGIEGEVMMLRRRFYLIALVLALIIPATIVYASHDSVTLNDGSTPVHQVDLLGTEVSGSNVTYTYAITGLGNVRQAISHWVLAIETCTSDEFLVSPTAGSTYDTPTNLAECGSVYDCQSASYTVTAGHDGSTGMTGLKFDIIGEGLKDEETHIFQITVRNILGEEHVNLLTKYGGSDTGSDETITGPVCPGPTAITLSSNNVSSPAAGALLPFMLIMGLALALSTTSIVLWRREATTG